MQTTELQAATCTQDLGRATVLLCASQAQVLYPAERSAATIFVPCGKVGSYHLCPQSDRTGDPEY